MTVLILAHRKIRDLLPRVAFGAVDLGFIFPNKNQNKILITGFFVIISLAVTAYLGSLYFIFQAGFVLREQEISLDKLDNEVKLKEVQASNLETTLAGDLEILKGMEKVSSVRYIKTSSEVSYK